MKNLNTVKYIKYITYLFAAMLMHLFNTSSFIPGGGFTVISQILARIGLAQISGFNTLLAIIQELTGIGGIILFYYTIFLVIKDIFTKDKTDIVD